MGIFTLRATSQTASTAIGRMAGPDKPPLAFWIQALSARIFGFNSWSILVPDALMGMGAVVVIYDLVRRRFGRIAGVISGLTLAITPIIPPRSILIS